MCDTNGGSLPSYIAEVVGVVKQHDPDAARDPHAQRQRPGGRQRAGRRRGRLHAGAGDDQRLGRALRQRQPDLDHPGAAAEDGPALRPRRAPGELTELSRAVSEIANIRPRAHAPYVGRSAFAHKGGMHVAAVEKVTHSYEHVAPERVGNRRHIVVSELAGRGNVRMRADGAGRRRAGQRARAARTDQGPREPGLPVRGGRRIVRAAGAAQRSPATQPPFEVLDVVVISERRRGNSMFAEATVKLSIGDEVVHTVAEGDGPGARAGRRVPQGAEPALPDRCATSTWSTTRSASSTRRRRPAPRRAC